MIEPIDVQLKKGVLELCVLELLSQGDSYAYEIASKLAEAIGMGEGTVYPLMRRLSSDGLVETYMVESRTGPSRKYYRLTRAGRAALAGQRDAWRSFTAAVDGIVGGKKMGETRLTFLATLRAGLRGAPPDAIDDIVADYASHFEVGAAKGRPEEDVAAALGDPLALADELRVEMRIESWEKKRTPVAAAKLIAGIVGLGLVNAALVFVALPLVCLFVFLAIANIILAFGAGVWLIFAGVSLGLGQAVSLLAGAGLVFGAIAFGALLALLLLALVSGLARYARLHYRLLPRSGLPSKEAP